MNATSEQWQALYEAAKEFKQASCWNWMENAHIFGVENPISKEIGYCCIMGNAGEMYGIAVYLGTKGLESLIRMASDEENDELMFIQDCLMLSFDSRDDLYPQEYKQMKELGLKFRGEHAWPTFRIYEPGFYPWPIETGEQVHFLTIALQQAIEVANAFKRDPDVLFEYDEQILTRVSTGDGTNLIWSDQWLVPKPVEKQSIVEVKFDELRAAKIKKSLQGRSEAWVIDCFYVPLPVKEGSRPYYPLMFLVVDLNSGQILQFHLFDQTSITNKIAEQFLELIEQIKVIPKEILVVRDSIIEYLGPILDTLNIEVYLVEDLPVLEEVKAGLMDHFMSGSY